MKEDTPPLAQDQKDPPPDATSLAVARTVMAADRSLMAWVRTGLSLISFGFTIYKFLDYSREQLMTAGKNLKGMSSPKLVGLFMVAMGIVSLIFGIIENIQTVKMLKGHYGVRRTRYALTMAGMLTLFGLFLFLAIIFQLRGFGS